MMSKYLYDFYLLKKGGKYFGHINYISRPTVFAFRKQRDLEKVKYNICNHVDYSIDGHNSEYFQIIYEHQLDMKRRLNLYEIERMGYIDMCLHITLNNVNLHIVDDVIEDDESNMYLMNCGTTVDPVFVNEMMTKLHLNKIISVQKILEG